MKKELKQILMVSLVVYGVFTLIHSAGKFITDPIESDFVSGIFKLNGSFLSMTSIILFVYVWDRGDEDIAKFGLLALCLSVFLTILNYFGVVSYSSEKIFDKIVLNVNSIVNAIEHVCRVFALFSLIKTNDDKIDKLKTVCVILYFVYAVINVIGNNVSPSKFSTFRNIGSVLDSFSTFAEYAFIILYLVNKGVNNTVQSQVLPNQNPPVGNVQNPMMPQQGIQQPIAQQPMMQQTMVQQPMTVNPMVQQPMMQQAMVQQPMMQQPMVANPMMPQQGIQQPMVQQPMVTNPMQQASITQPF